MPRHLLAFALLCLLACAPFPARAEVPTLFPANNARGVSPDTPLKLHFRSAPTVGSRGTVRIVDMADGQVVDTLDLSIPASPNPDGRPRRADGATRAPTPPAPAGPDNPGFQADQIGGAWFHFFPVMVRGTTAIITPHHGKLRYGRRYRVEIDPEVVGGAGFTGVAANAWTFSTKPAPPPAAARRVVVSADGRGDFATVQGAVDWAPAAPPTPVEIFIRNGRYQEIVYLSGKRNLTLRGQSRDGVVVAYANNSAFNRIRPAFSVTNSDDIQLSTFTINNDFSGQAEALLMRGERNIVDRMTLNGSGDAFTTYGTIYMVDSSLTGDGDTILGYAALYCLRCTIRSVGPFTWTRTPKGRHGNVFVGSTFIYLDKPLPWSITPANPAGTKVSGVFARLPKNGSATAVHSNFPYAEMVLIDTKTSGVPPVGWGPVQAEPDFDWSNVRFWEFRTTDLRGKPVDMSQRHPIVRQLRSPKDAGIVADYRRPAFVLGGWEPVVRR